MYELIQHQKLESAASTITFSNIPQTWTDLYLVVSLRKGDGENYFGLQFNGSQANTSSRMLIGTGSTTASYAYSQANKYNIFGYPNSSTETAATFGSASVYISNYTSASAKSVSLDSVSENNGTSAIQQLQAGLWNSTAAITSLSLVGVNSSLDAGGTFVAGSSATLYGINRTSAIGKPKAVGGSITYSNGYWYHTFTGSGTLYTQESLEVDALVVGGGGGGGAYDGGGGGAGGFVTSSGILLNTQSSYPVIVGSGGPGGIYYLRQNGQASSFLNVSASGGGGGGSADSAAGGQENGAAGASGGGARGGRLNGNSGGTGIPGQGSNGGSSAGSSGYGAGGGGGAGGVGTNGTTTSNGSGGPGLMWVNGSFYAGGGGGASLGYGIASPGIGGIGGGGAAGNTPVAGTANTGGGGGADADGALGGAGGSGVVIIRYRA